MLSFLKQLFGLSQPKNTIPNSADELIQLFSKYGPPQIEKDLELQLFLTPDMDAPEAPVELTQRQRTLMYAGVSMCCGVPAAWAYCTYAMELWQHSR